MVIQFQIISGLMFGLEFVWEEGLVVIDLAIIRIIFGKYEDE